MHTSMVFKEISRSKHSKKSLSSLKSGNKFFRLKQKNFGTIFWYDEAQEKDKSNSKFF